MLKRIPFVQRRQSAAQSLTSKKASKKSQHKRPLALFAREILHNPRSIGAVCPSSPYLARAMAAHLPQNKDGLIVELGGGTGNISAALLEQGLPAKRLVILERATKLANYLKQRFPQAHVIQGDAAELKDLLGERAENVQGVISGLPLRAFPKDLANAIVQQVHEVLPDDGVYVQFTYDLRGQPSNVQQQGFQRQSSKIIWRNIPPARVESFIKG